MSRIPSYRHLSPGNDMDTRQETEKGQSFDPSTQGAPAPEKAGLFEDFIEIFYAPSQVFTRRQNGAYGMMLLIVSVIAAAFAFTSRAVTAAIFDVEFTRRAAEQMAKNPQITQDMVNSMRPMQENIAMVGGYIGTPIIILIVAFLAWLAAKVVSAKISWNQAMAIVTLAWIPRLLQGLVNTVQALLMDTTSITTMHDVGFSPARFMGDDTSSKVLSIVSRFDVFTLWTTVLIGIGIAIMAKAPRSKGYMAAGLVWLVGTTMAFFG